MSYLLGIKEESRSRLTNTFSDYIDPISTVQHFTPTNWLLNNSQHSQLTYDAISSASTSPWSQTHQQLEDRFRRQMPQSNCINHSNHYSTPPYNPNGNFDYGYPELNSPYKASPVPLETDHSTKSALSYEITPPKQTLFQLECEELPCGNNSPTAPVYGFTSS